MKIPAKKKEPENEVRDKRKNQGQKIIIVLKGGNIFKEGVVSISYAIKCCKTRKVYMWRSLVTSLTTVSVLDHTTLRSE